MNGLEHTAHLAATVTFAMLAVHLWRRLRYLEERVDHHPWREAERLGMVEGMADSASRMVGEVWSAQAKLAKRVEVIEAKTGGGPYR